MTRFWKTHIRVIYCYQSCDGVTRPCVVRYTNLLLKHKSKLHYICLCKQRYKLHVQYVCVQTESQATICLFVQAVIQATIYLSVQSFLHILGIWIPIFEDTTHSHRMINRTDRILGPRELIWHSDIVFDIDYFYKIWIPTEFDSLFIQYGTKVHVCGIGIIDIHALFI